MATPSSSGGGSVPAACSPLAAAVIDRGSIGAARGAPPRPATCSLRTTAATLLPCCRGVAQRTLPALVSTCRRHRQRGRRPLEGRGHQAEAGQGPQGGCRRRCCCRCCRRRRRRRLLLHRRPGRLTGRCWTASARARALLCGHDCFCLVASFRPRPIKIFDNYLPFSFAGAAGAQARGQGPGRQGQVQRGRGGGHGERRVSGAGGTAVHAVPCMVHVPSNKLWDGIGAEACRRMRVLQRL